MRRLALALMMIGAGACTSSPTAPDPPLDPTPQPLRLEITGDPVIDLTSGEARGLQIVERDAAGAIVTRPSSEYAWSSSAAGVVSVNSSGGIRAVADFGTAVISARSPAGLVADKRIWVQLPESRPSTYRITLIFSDSIPIGWRDSFRDAARHWERVIRAPLPPIALHALPPITLDNPVCDQGADTEPMPPQTGIETGTRIFIARRNWEDRPYGGVCVFRPSPRPTSAVGRITFGRYKDEVVSLPAFLTRHEIGHALGLVGFSPSASGVPWFDASTSRYTGPLALEGYRRTFGLIEPFLPANGHWGFEGDVMGAENDARISKASVGALMDMGYPAAWYGADR